MSQKLYDPGIRNRVMSAKICSIFGAWRFGLRVFRLSQIIKAHVTDSVASLSGRIV